MPDYYDLIRATVPQPTDEQISRFIGYIVNSHSWYKKLPLLPPGEPFYLYLSPHVHQVSIANDDATISYWRDIIEEAPVDEDRMFPKYAVDYREGDEPLSDGEVFLGTWAKNMTSQQRRERYGHWLYWNPGTGRGERLDDVDFGVQELYVVGDTVALDADGEPVDRVHVPTELVEKGLVYLTATVSGTLLQAREDEYSAYRAAFDVPSIEDAQCQQVKAIKEALMGFRSLVWPE